MKSLIIALSLLVTPAFAHEGHDHDAPKAMKAPKGGQLKTLEKTTIEVVSKGSDLKVYLYNKDFTPKSAEGFKVTAEAEIPRTKKKSNIEMKAQENSFEGKFDGQGSHRYMLRLTVTDPGTGHSDKLEFNIEPRK